MPSTDLSPENTVMTQIDKVLTLWPSYSSEWWPIITKIISESGKWRGVNK